MAKRKRRYRNLKAYLADLPNGMTQADFAARMGISPQHLSDIKNGARGASLQLAKRLADECGVPIESFLVGEQPQSIS
jgi:transcriptional regulator with XRE-family HTH domain